MAASELEWIFNDFSFGVGSSTGSAWLVQDVQGLALEEYRSDIVTIGGSDGAWVYSALKSEMHIILTGEYASTDDRTMETIVSDFFDAWLPAFEPQITDVALHFNYPGLGPKYVMCKPINRHFDQNQLFSLGYTNWAVELVAGDPTIFDDMGS